MITEKIDILNMIVAPDYCVAIGFQVLYLEPENYPHRKLWHKAINLSMPSQTKDLILSDSKLMLFPLHHSAFFPSFLSSWSLCSYIARLGG